MKFKLNCLLLLGMLNLISCNLKKETPKIRSKEDALTAYEEFKDKFHNADKSSTYKLLNNLNAWKELEEQVFHHIASDTTPNQSHSIQEKARCAIIRNDIKNEVIRFIDNHQYTYTDIIDIHQSFNEYNFKDRFPDIFHEAENFFNGLTKQVYSEKSMQEIMTEYTNRLLYWKSKGFSSRQDMLEFIKEEDSLFTLFLSHLYEYDSKSIGTIIEMTSHISNLMIQAANKDKLDRRELGIYFGMRTNRRLIQNAIKCAEAIRLGQVKTPEQATMTVFILLNPYSNYNRLCTGAHTKKQIEALQSLGVQIPQLVNQLKQKGLIREQLPDSLPGKIIKEHILITMK